MDKYIKLDDAAEAMWRILNGLGYSEKHNDRLVEEVDAELANYPSIEIAEGTDG